MLKFFLDTSILVSVCISDKGASAEIIKQAVQQKVIVFVSPYVFTELNKVISRQTNPILITRANDLQSLNIWHMVQPTTQQVENASKACDDLDDAEIIAGAKISGAHVLVSFDRKHLHTEKVIEYLSAKVVCTGEALQLIRTNQ